MPAGLPLLVAAFLSASGPGQPLEQVLSRVSEEAEAFRLAAPNLLAREKLTQRALRPPARFRPRLGSAALQPPKPQYRTREVISEYGFAGLKGAPAALHEFRQVVSVDNRQISSPEKARRTLTAGLRSDDDRVKKQMLEDFEKHGLTGAAADFGQVLLLFTRRRLGDFSFAWAGEGRVGPERARIVSFRQTGGEGTLVIFQKRAAVHQPLQGQLWVRADDSMPLRVVLVSARQEGAATLRDEATVDYATTPRGYLAPVSVTHRETSAGSLIVENVYQYADYRVFGAEADVKFPEAR